MKKLPVKHKYPAVARIVCAMVVKETPVITERGLLTTPEEGYAFWQSVVATSEGHEPSKENLVCVSLNTRFRPVCWNLVSVGTLDETVAHPREVLRPVIASGAHGFVLMHNHPSGEAMPSQADERMTRNLVECSRLMQVRLHDHIIIGAPAPGRQPYFSFREAGLCY